VTDRTPRRHNDSKADLSIVIPCFNEADNSGLLREGLWPVVDQLRQGRTVEIVFVDDGSTDGTGDLLESAFGQDPGVRVIRHDRNRGLGAALRTAFRYATGDVIVTTDSDATYPFSLIVPLLARLGPNVDVVTSSCYHPEGGIDNVPAYRVFLSKSASLIYRVLLDRRIHTYTALFRAYRREVIQSVTFTSDDFLSVTELLANALIAGYTVAELPCTLRVRRYGASKARIARIIRSHLAFQVEVLRKRIRPPARVAVTGRAPKVG
jgi:dolichol-phosphate mannosyltransferase